MADQLLTTASTSAPSALRGKARHVALNRSHAELHSVALAPDHALGSQLDSDAVDFGCVRENLIHAARDGQHEMVAIVETAQGSMKATSGHGPGAVEDVLHCTAECGTSSASSVAADQLLTGALVRRVPVEMSGLSACSSRIVSSGSYAALSQCGRYADHGIAMLALVCLQSLRKHFHNLIATGLHQINYCSAHSLCGEYGTSDLERQFQAPAQRELTEIQCSISERSDLLSSPNEARTVLFALNQLLGGAQPRGRINCGIAPCENRKCSFGKSQFVSEPERDDCIKSARVSPLPYQWREQGDQYANHCPHRSPCVPPDDAAVLPRRPARAECIPPAHSLIPRCTGQHSATRMLLRVIDHG
ncbi:hypothetical protein I5W35_03685 [Stenotrophomonas maltophilia]|nr:hypothetical protein [Stenotrophomonas maltophilia]